MTHKKRVSSRGAYLLILHSWYLDLSWWVDTIILLDLCCEREEYKQQVSKENIKFRGKKTSHHEPMPSVDIS